MSEVSYEWCYGYDSLFQMTDGVFLWMDGDAEKGGYRSIVGGSVIE